MRVRAVLVASAVFASLAGAMFRVPMVLAQPPVTPVAAATPPGRLTERVLVAGDSSRAFAVYEPPPARAGGRRTPVLLVLDPRGRALDALRLFAPAAEALGWVVISSYNSASDGAEDPNLVAVRDMLEWGQRSLRLDMRRVYLAGMSGTARATWLAMADYRPYVAGLLLAAGTTPAPGAELGLVGDPAFSVVTTTGTGDFNYEEVRRLGERLDSLKVAARVDWTDGPHGWPSEEIVTRALWWFERRAARSGRTAVDTLLLARSLLQDVARVDSLEKAGHWDLAERLAASLARDGSGSAAGTTLVARAAELAARPAMRSFRDRLRRELDRERAQPLEIERALAWERAQFDTPEADEILKRLDVPALRRSLASPDSVASASASRRLARVQVMLAFYAPAAWERAGRPERAARLREAARAVNPARPRS